MKVVFPNIGKVRLFGDILELGLNNRYYELHDAIKGKENPLE